MNPLWQQKELNEYCKAKGIHVSAHSPLGSKGTLWGDNRIFDCHALKVIAEAKGKTIAQVDFSLFLVFLVVGNDFYKYTI